MPTPKVPWNDFVEIWGDLSAGQQLSRLDRFRKYSGAQDRHRRQNSLNWINSHQCGTWSVPSGKAFHALK
jgi:hypothetical protein